MSNANTHRIHSTRAAGPTGRRPARLALSLDDPGSSGIVDVHCLRAEPPPPSLASIGPPGPGRATSSSPWTVVLGGAVALSLMMLGGAAAWRSSNATVPERVADRHGALAIHEASVPSTEGTLRLAARDDVPERWMPRRGAGVTGSAPDEADEPDDAEGLAAQTESPPAPDLADETEAAEAPKTRPVDSPSTSRSDRKPTRPKAPSPKRSSTRASTRTPAGPTSIPVECVLDPSRCDASGRPAPKATAPRPAPRPEKLSISQLKQALAKTKPDARRCGIEHGVAPGTTVRVKLSIEGVSGSVLSAAAQGEHATGSLGRCVALALSRTRFPEFQAPRMGTIYSIRM